MKWPRRRPLDFSKPLEETIVFEQMVRLRAEGLRVFRIRERIPGAWKSSEAGLPDLFGFLPSTQRIFFIECKRDSKAHRRPSQIRFIEEAQRDGAIAFFTWSWENTVTEFKKHGIVLRV